MYECLNKKYPPHQIHKYTGCLISLLLNWVGVETLSQLMTSLSPSEPSVTLCIGRNTCLHNMNPIWPSLFTDMNTQLTAILWGTFKDFLWNICECLLQLSADWERASLRPSSHPSSVFKSSPVIGTYSTEGGFINTNLVTTDEESQEFDDLIFALKTGEESTCTFLSLLE